MIMWCLVPGDAQSLAAPRRSCGQAVGVDRTRTVSQVALNWCSDPAA